MQQLNNVISYVNIRSHCVHFFYVLFPQSTTCTMVGCRCMELEFNPTFHFLPLMTIHYIFIFHQFQYRIVYSMQSSSGGTQSQVTVTLLANCKQSSLLFQFNPMVVFFVCLDFAPEFESNFYCSVVFQGWYYDYYYTLIT